MNNPLNNDRMANIDQNKDLIDLDNKSCILYAEHELKKDLEEPEVVAIKEEPADMGHDQITDKNDPRQLGQKDLHKIRVEIAAKIADKEKEKEERELFKLMVDIVDLCLDNSFENLMTPVPHLDPEKELQKAQCEKSMAEIYPGVEQHKTPTFSHEVLEKFDRDLVTPVRPIPKPNLEVCKTPVALPDTVQARKRVAKQIALLF